MRRYLDYILAALAALLIGIGVDAGSVVYANAAQAHSGVVISQSLPYQPPTATSPVRPESTRQVRVHGVLAKYRIVSGDTLAGISDRTYGNYRFWPTIYTANKSTISNPDLIYPGQTLTIPARPHGAPPSAPKSKPTTGKGKTSSTPSVPTSSLSGTLGCSGLEALWVAAGGRQSAAFIAAEIAMAESGGRQYAHSPTNDFGYWQINGVHGSLATYNPLGNAKAAVIISSNGSNWSPWTTYTSGAYHGECSSASLVSVVTPGSGGSVVARPPTVGSTRASRALAWALTQAGKWYQWAGAGPSVYDCSGLVMRAYERVGIDLPHNTVLMLRSGHLHWTSHPRPGDLVMWGGSSPYHVEFYIYAGHSFGAHRPGKQISIEPLWGSPSFYTVS